MTTSKVFPSPKNWQRAGKICELFYGLDMSTKAIAKKYGMTYNNVLIILKRAKKGGPVTMGIDVKNFETNPACPPPFIHLIKFAA